MPGGHQQVAAGRERRLLRGGCLGAGLLWCTGGGPGRAGRRRGRRCRGRRRRPGWRSPRGGGRGARRRAGGVHSAAGAARTSPGRRAWRVVRRRRALRRACPDALVGGGGRGGRDGGGRWQRRGGAIGRDGGAAGWCCKPWRGRGGARRGTAGAGGWTVWLRVVQAGGSVPDTVAEATLAPWRGGACGWLAGPAAPLGPGGGTGPVWLRVCCDAPLRRRTNALCAHARLVRQEGGRFFAARTHGASLHAPPVTAALRRCGGTAGGCRPGPRGGRALSRAQHSAQLNSGRRAATPTPHLLPSVWPRPRARACRRTTTASGQRAGARPGSPRPLATRSPAESELSHLLNPPLASCCTRPKHSAFSPPPSNVQHARRSRSAGTRLAIASAPVALRTAPCHTTPHRQGQRPRPTQTAAARWPRV